MEVKLNCKFGILLVRNDSEPSLVRIIKELMALLWSMILRAIKLSKIFKNFGQEKLRNLRNQMLLSLLLEISLIKQRENSTMLMYFNIALRKGLNIQR